MVAQEAASCWKRERSAIVQSFSKTEHNLRDLLKFNSSPFFSTLSYFHFPENWRKLIQVDDYKDGDNSEIVRAAACFNLLYNAKIHFTKVFLLPRLRLTLYFNF